MYLKIFFLLFFIFSNVGFAQDAALSSEEGVPNGKRIRRQLNFIVGVHHDEEFLIPDKPLVMGGRPEFFKDIKRIQGTDYFRFFPQKAGNGLLTFKDKTTGQIIVEIRFDIRDDTLEKTMREIQALLADIEGVEYKIVNGSILLDGYVLLPRDLIRIGQVLNTYGQGTIKNLVTLSPLAREKIATFISNDINNPEVKVSAIGDFIKIEGQVNSQDEKDRILRTIELYLPDVVTSKAPNLENVLIQGRKTAVSNEFIIDLVTIKKDNDKVEPPPKMIQIVTHFVKFNDNYLKDFSFAFAPILSTQVGSSQLVGSTISETAQLINNLLPKLNWAKFHGFAKVLDTASVLTQDKKPASIVRNVTSQTTSTQNGQTVLQPTVQSKVSLSVTPVIKSERSGLIELPLRVEVQSPGKSEGTNTVVETTISVKDRSSAAFGGIIKKDADTSYGSPNGPDPQTILSLKASKSYVRNNSQFVVFVTPIIKSSASSGVEQVKKKFRLRD